MLNFKGINPEFYNTYISAREVVDPATQTTKITGTVISKAKGEPLADVTITVSGQEHSATTNSTGGYTLKIPIPGTYKIVFEKTGYQPGEAKAEVKLGSTSTVNMTLIPLS